MNAPVIDQYGNPVVSLHAAYATPTTGANLTFIIIAGVLLILSGVALRKIGGSENA